MELKSITNKFWTLLAASALFVSCSEDNAEELDVISLNRESYECGVEGGTVDITVTSSTDWKLEGYNYWAVPSAIEGKSGDVVTFTIEENLSLQQLEGDFVFVAGNATKAFKITQIESIYIPDGVTFSPAVPNYIPFEGGSVTVTIHCENPKKGWKMENVTYNWLTVSKISGEDGDEVTFTADPSMSPNDRIAKFKYQSGKATEILEIHQSKHPTSPNDIVLSAESATVDYEGGIFEMEVVSALFDWTMSASILDWFEIDGPASGTKDDKNVKYRFTIKPNTGRQRILTATFKAGATTKYVRITQKSVPVDPNDIVLNNLNFTIPKEGGSIQVIAKSDLWDWKVTPSNSGGFTIDNNQKTGAVGETVIYNITAPANTSGRSKTSRMYFYAGATTKTVTITQAG